MPKRRKGQASSRPVQVGEQVREAISEMLQEGALKDPRLKAATLITVTEVRMTADLELGRVLVSVYPDEESVVAEVFEGLGKARPHVKRELGRRLRLRKTPELRFLVDDSMAYGAKIEALLKQINAEEGAASRGDDEG